MPCKPAQQTERIDPAELAAGYMFPELFVDKPLTLHSEIADDSPFAPSAAVQHTIPDLPPVDWEHIRKKQRAQRQTRRRRRNRVVSIFVAEDDR